MSDRPGLTFTRMAMAIAGRHLKSGQTVDDAIRDRWPEDRDTLQAAASLDRYRELRSAVAAGSLGPTWGSEIAATADAVGEFLALVRAESIVGRLALRRVPANTLTLRQTGPAIVYWTQEGHPIPLGKMALDRVSLQPKKCAGLIVVTDELLEFGGAEAEQLVRADLVAGTAALTDRTFLDRGNAGSASTPASVTYGAPATAATADPRADLVALMANFGGDLTKSVLVTDPITAAGMNGTQFPDVGANGGTLLGLPVLTSKASPRTTAGGQIALIDPTGILAADAGADVQSGFEAAIQMTDSPAGDATTPTGSTNVVSLYQVDCTAFRVIRYVTWQVGRTGSVAVITGAAY